METYKITSLRAKITGQIFFVLAILVFSISCGQKHYMVQSKSATAVSKRESANQTKKIVIKKHKSSKHTKNIDVIEATANTDDAKSTTKETAGNSSTKDAQGGAVIDESELIFLEEKEELIIDTSEYKDLVLEDDMVVIDTTDIDIH
ncbi:MAG: hypothetical protein M3Q56_12345 [Bacteroidota bacterium]|nr:hypothetical protein [Bacteroidota bacterium]